VKVENKQNTCKTKHKGKFKGYDYRVWAVGIDKGDVIDKGR